MHTRILFPALLLTLAVASTANADTYTWAGNTGNFSDPASWMGAPPPLGGSPTETLNFTGTPSADSTYTATVDSSGPWVLNDLELNANSDLNPVLHFTTPFTINAAIGASLSFTGPSPEINANGYQSVFINASIASDSSLYLNGPWYDINPAAGIYIGGTANSFTGGVVIGDSGAVYVSANSSLGSGPIELQTGAILHLASPNNVGANGSILMDWEATLAISFDQNPTALIDPHSVGTIAFDADFSTSLDLSTIGNGLMSVAAGAANVTYSASSLAPDADHVYRFTASYTQSILTVSKGVLIDYNGIPSSAQLYDVNLAAPNSYSGSSFISNGVYVSAPGALGTGDIYIGDIVHPYGSLTISSPNAYSSSAQVVVYGTLSAVGPNGTIPSTSIAPIFEPGSVLVLGDNISNNSDRYPDAMPLNLHSSTLVLEGFGNTNENVGPISSDGVSTIVLQNSTLESETTVLHAPSLTVALHSVLFIIPFPLQPLNAGFPTVNNSLEPTTPSSGTVQIDSPPLVTNGIVPPYIQFRSQWINSEDAENDISASFLSYTSTGFSLPNYSPLPINGGTGTEVVDITEADETAADRAAIFAHLQTLASILSSLESGSASNGQTIVVNSNPAPLLGVTVQTDISVYALRTPMSLLNPPDQPVTLQILSGGLIITNSLTIQPNLDFGQAEAFINVDGQLDIPPISLVTGQVTARNGLTKFGPGTLNLTNPTNQIIGPVTVLEGTLGLSNVPSPTSADPITVYGGATLSFLNSVTLSRPVNIPYGDNVSNLNAQISVPSDQSLVITAPISAQCPAIFYAGPLIHVQAPITSTTDITFYANELRIDSVVTGSSISFQPGATGKLTGTGVISSPSIFYFTSLGMISPGDVPGDLGSLSFDVPVFNLILATFEADLDAYGHCDQLLCTGQFWIDDDPNTTLSLNFLAPPDGQIYTLVTASEIDGTFASVTGLPASYSLDYTPTSILLVPNFLFADGSVPEPATLLIMFVALPLLRKPRRFV